MTAPNPWLTIPRIHEHTGVSEYEVRKDMKRPAEDRRHLPAVLHMGKLKARLTDVDAWVERNSTPA